jgi:paired small multidrug resistance pump
MEYSWHDVIGNTGVLLVLGIYLMLQLEKVSPTAAWFSIVNAAGAVLILISLTQSFNFSAVIIEASWLLISLYGLARSLTNAKAVT